MRFVRSLAIASSLLAFSPAFAGSLGYQQATGVGATSAVGLPNIPTGTIGSVLITAEGQALRWRADGTAPTSAVGNPIPVGGSICYGYDPHSFQVIGQVAGATIDADYYTGLGCATR